jgi:hypothetical protein
VSVGVDEIMRRREQLIAQCESQRSDIAMYVGGLDTPIRLADRALRVWQYLRDHPLALGASIVALAVAQRRGFLKWAQRAFVVWRTWRSLRGYRNAI